MASGNRLPTSRERENNRRRERRRRAIAAKIFAGLRTYGNYKLPKHCDNNEVLKALCDEAGWVVEQDGTTYRKGCKPAERTDPVAYTASPSPCSSYQPSRCTSYNPSPNSSSFPSPERTPFGNNYRDNDRNNEHTLPPWLKNLPPKHHHLFMQQGISISAPVTPPISSPTGGRSPRRLKIDREAALSFLQSSTPSSPRRDSSWLAGICIPSEGPASPTYSLVARNSVNPFGSPSAWTPGQSGTCSPAMLARHEDAEMRATHDDEFAFESSGDGSMGLVKAWEGETIHEECGPDELELTLGITRTSST